MHLGVDLRTLDRPGMELSGLGRYGIELTSALAAARPRWRITVYGNRPEILPAPLRPRVRRTRVPTSVGPGRIAWLHGVSAFETARDRPDVWFSPAFVLPAWRRGPSVVTIHDLSFMLLPERYRGRANARYAAVATRLSAHRADRIVVGASETRELVARHLRVDPAKVEVIPYGVSERFYADSDPPDGAPYLLFVGTFEARKGLEVLYEAFRQLVAGHPSVRLVLAGSEGWGTAELLSRMQRDPLVDIHISPGDDELRELYRGALALTYLSRMEGFGLPVAEAMAAGAPVVATDLACIREFAGDAPRYVEIGDPAAVATHVATLLDNPEEVARRRAASRAAAEGLRWEAVAEATAAVLESARSC